MRSYMMTQLTQIPLIGPWLVPLAIAFVIGLFNAASSLLFSKAVETVPHGVGVAYYLRILLHVPPYFLVAGFISFVVLLVGKTGLIERIGIQSTQAISPFSLAISMAFLSVLSRDTMSVTQWLGFVVIVAGTFLVLLPKGT